MNRYDHNNIEGAGRIPAIPRIIRSLTIKNKFLFINSLTLLMILSITGFIWLSFAYTESRDFLNQRIASQGDLVSHNISAAIIFNDRVSSRTILSSLSYDPAIISATVSSGSFESDLTVTFPQGKLDQGLFSVAELFSDASVRQFEIVEGGLNIGTLEISFSQIEIFESLLAVIQVVFLTTLFAIVVGLGLANRLQKFVTTPIFHLIETTRKVSQSKNYAIRYNIDTPDELGELGKGLNSLLGIIEEGKNYLERNIQNRTRELQDKNVELLEQIERRIESDKAREEVEEVFEQAFINAPIGMALINEDLYLIRSNHNFDKLLDLPNWDSPYLLQVIYLDYQDDIERQFSSLVSGKISRFESKACCRGKLESEVEAVFQFSAIHRPDGSFLHAVLQVQDVTESSRLSKELAYQANHDALTGLVNRRVLDIALKEISEQDLDHEMPHALCCLDLDQFKLINDTCGHAGGDELLRRVSDTIKKQTREDDLTVRMGGDEFAVLLYHCGVDNARKIAEKIRQEVEKIFFSWEGNTFKVTTSIGAVICGPDRFDPDSVMLKADTACFQAKESGRNRVFMVDSESSLDSLRREQSRWVQRLRQAMDENQFMLYGQPIFAVNKHRNNEKHFEILLRLQDENGKILSPGTFLPAAERYGLMVSIDCWVIQHLVDQLSRNPDKAIDGSVAYWINLSGQSISDDAFRVFLKETIKKAKIPPKVLNFEITETYFISNMKNAKALISEVSELGCQFSLDDFGSGMSSFGYLKQLPVDFIKIDGMFIKDMLEDSINVIFVKNIIELASAIGKKTVAEYVENDELHEIVKGLGVDYCQGYGLGTPQPLFQDASDICLGHPVARVL